MHVFSLSNPLLDPTRPSKIASLAKQFEKAVSDNLGQELRTEIHFLKDVSLYGPTLSFGKHEIEGLKPLEHLTDIQSDVSKLSQQKDLLKQAGQIVIDHYAFADEAQNHEIVVARQVHKSLSGLASNHFVIPSQTPCGNAFFQGTMICNQVQSSMSFRNPLLWCSVQKDGLAVIEPLSESVAPVELKLAS